MVSGIMKPEDVVKAYYASATELGTVVQLDFAAVISLGVKTIGFGIQNLQKLPIVKVRVDRTGNDGSCMILFLCTVLAPCFSWGWSLNMQIRLETCQCKKWFSGE